MPTPAEQLAGLQAQLRAIQARGPGSSFDQRTEMGRRQYNENYKNWQRQQFAINDQIVALNNASGGGGDAVDKAKDELYGLARGAVSRTNSIDDLLLQALQERSGKDAGPFDATTRNALMTQASDAAGQAMLNAKGRISGSAGDPSVMAANNEADARRSQAIQQAQLGINTQANVANYDARGQALGQLGSYNQQVQGNKTDNERYLMGLLAQETQYQPDQQQGSMGVPTFTQFRQQPQAQARPAATQRAGSAPATAPRLTNPNGLTNQAVAFNAARPATTAVRNPGVPLPPTQQQLNTPWNAQNLNPYAPQVIKQPSQWTAKGSAGTRTGKNR